MVVMTPREKWTDERLDDLNKKVDETKAEMREGFARIDEDFRELRSEMNDRFIGLENRLEALNRTLIGGFFVLIAAVIGGNAF
ncbi:MAG TPA: hypothetical protein VFX44_04180 [Solirubrobacterales bacterium]|nr:hypothetical protein [Solirubrobacterales bacterium]